MPFCSFLNAALFFHFGRHTRLMNVTLLWFISNSIPFTNVCSWHEQNRARQRAGERERERESESEKNFYN